MKERNAKVDNIKAILIILVVAGHFGSTGSVLSNAIVTLIFSFHMPLFMFISGYLSKNLEGCREKAVKEYLFIFLVAQTAWIVYKIIASKDLYYLTHMSEPGFGLWYILAIFVYRILLKDLVKIKFLIPLAGIASVGVMAITNIEYCFDLQRIIGFMVYFLIGYYTNESTFQKIKKIPAAFAASGILAIGIGIYIVLDKGWLEYYQLLDMLRHQMTVYEFSSIFAGLAMYTLMIPISLVLGILVLAAIPEKRLWFTYIGVDTLPLYLSHTYIVVFYRDHLKDQVMNSQGMFVVLLALTWFCVILFSGDNYRKYFHLFKCKLQSFFNKGANLRPEMESV